MTSSTRSTDGCSGSLNQRKFESSSSAPDKEIDVSPPPLCLSSRTSSAPVFHPLQSSLRSFFVSFSSSIPSSLLLYLPSLCNWGIVHLWKLDPHRSKRILAPAGPVALRIPSVEVVDDKLREISAPDRLSHVPSQFHHVRDVVQRNKSSPRLLLRHHAVQVRAREGLAGRAAAVLLNGLLVLLVALVLQLHVSVVSQGNTKSRRPRRIHTVEHVHPESHAHNQIDGIAYTHAVSRLVCWKQLRTTEDDLPELIFRFSTRQSTDRVAWQVSFYQLVTAAGSKLKIKASLHYPEEILLLGLLVSCDAAIDPSERAVHGFLHSCGIWRSAADHVVQRHDDVGSNLVLQLDRLLRSQQHLATIGGGLERNTFFGDVGKLQQRDHLETPAVRQNRSPPPHEIMEPSQFIQQLCAGTESKMIRVAQDDGDIQRF
mmetsp:Transcript_2869/g.6867  ORF Transcript_2869/g.6867 Transcript_2869/m.6867 type:complete len:428 (+) Transcript_2869:2187-3470(+)